MHHCIILYAFPCNSAWHLSLNTVGSPLDLKVLWVWAKLSCTGCICNNDEATACRRDQQGPRDFSLHDHQMHRQLANAGPIHSSNKLLKRKGSGLFWWFLLYVTVTVERRGRQGRARGWHAAESQGRFRSRLSLGTWYVLHHVEPLRRLNKSAFSWLAGRRKQRTPAQQALYWPDIFRQISPVHFSTNENKNRSDETISCIVLFLWTLSLCLSQGCQHGKLTCLTCLRPYEPTLFLFTNLSLLGNIFHTVIKKIINDHPKLRW